MKDPQRLLDAPASELELRLLRAGANEQPPSAAAQRLAQTLGASGAVKLPPAAASKLSLLPLGIAAVGMTLAGLVGLTWMASRPAAPTPPPVAEAAPAPGAVPAAPAPAAQEPEPATNTLALEIARIDSIRRLIATARARTAIAALQDYQRDFPTGVLRQEADVLNIEAHEKAGERRRARVLASRFLASNPNSPHRSRVRDLLEELGPDAR